MRILHTADWHLGQNWNGWPREAEHRAFLGALVDLVAREEIDAMIVAGDVYDGANPGAESQQLLYETLIALRRARPHFTSVLIAGNHDSAARLEAPAALAREIGAHFVGAVQRRDGALDLNDRLIALRDARGAIGAHVLALPFLRAIDLPLLKADENAGESAIVRATRELYAQAHAQARARMGDGPLIATGHLTCLGALESAGGPDADSAERRILIGGEHAAPPNIFPLDLAYVALGHLHRPQTVEGRAIRYSGAPFPLSASELSYAHGVTILDIGAELLWRHVDLPRPVPCLRLPARGALAPEELESAIAALGLDPEAPREQQPFVYVVIAPQGPAAGVGLEIERRLEKAPLRCAGVKIVRPALGPIEAPAPVKPLADCDPAELFARAFAQAHGGPPQPQHWAAFDALRQDL